MNLHSVAQATVDSKLNHLQTHLKGQYRLLIKGHLKLIRHQNNHVVSSNGENGVKNTNVIVSII